MYCTAAARLFHSLYICVGHTFGREWGSTVLAEALISVDSLWNLVPSCSWLYKSKTRQEDRESRENHQRRED